MLKRFLVLACLTLTLFTMGVSAFAFQPPALSPLVEYGAYQIGDFNSNLTCSVSSATCSVCGASGTSYRISKFPDDPYDGVIAIIDATSLNREFNGVYNLLDENHLASDHAINTAFLNRGSLSYIDIFVTRGIIGTDVRYTALYIPFPLASSSGAINFVSSYAVSVTAQVAYSYGLLSPYPLQDFIDAEISQSLLEAYNDGQINASENVNAFNFIEEVIDGVAQPILNALSDVSVMGISLLNLIYLAVTLIVVLIIVKVVRG